MYYRLFNFHSAYFNMIDIMSQRYKSTKKRRYLHIYLHKKISSVVSRKRDCSSHFEVKYLAFLIFFFFFTVENQMTEVCHEWRLSELSGMAFSHTVSYTSFYAHSPQHSWSPQSPAHWNACIQTHTDTLTQLPSWSPPNNNACCHYTLESDTIDPQLTGVCLDRAAWCSTAVSSVFAA